MKASDVRIADLETWDDCYDAIEEIETDYQNDRGGIQAWNSGLQTQLTASAEKKIAAIRRKMDRLNPEEVTA